MKTLLIASLLLASLSCQAEPLAGVNLSVKVQSLDEKWAHVTYAGKQVRIPRAAVRGPASVKTQEVHLSADEYDAMKRDYFLLLK
jgi:hypothetical protein